MALGHGRQLATALVAVAFTAATVGCGESGTDARSATGAVGGTTSPTRGADRSDCERRGLLGSHVVTPRDAEGTCRAGGGQIVTLVGFGRTAQLGDLSFRVEHTRMARRLSNGPIDQVARGVFVIVSVTVANESGAVQRIAKNQFELIMNDRRFHFDRRATVVGDPQSLWQLTLRGLRPGATITGDVVFDVSRRLGATLIDGGFITGASFATVAAGHPVPHEPLGFSPLS